MPFYQIKFQPPKDFDDLDGIYAIVLAETAEEAREKAQECLDAEWKDEDLPDGLLWLETKGAEEYDYLAFARCEFHEHVLI